MKENASHMPRLFYIACVKKALVSSLSHLISQRVDRTGMGLYEDQQPPVV